MKQFRLNRLFNAKSGRCFDVAVDHGFFNTPGFLTGIEDMPSVIETLVDAGPDAIQLTVGQARHLQAIRGRQKPSLVLRTDVANVYGKDIPEVLFSSMIEEAMLQAVRYDAACICVNLFSIPDADDVYAECVNNILRLKPQADYYGMPMMVEPLVFRPNAEAGGYMVDGDLVKIKHLVRQAVELGADVIKADPTANATEYHEVVQAAGGIPILVRGGGRVDDHELLVRTREILDQGAAGIVYGRNVIQHANPRGMTQALMALVHENANPRRSDSTDRMKAGGPQLDTVNVGIIGGGLMGRETASAFARWCALTDIEVQPHLVSVADPNPQALAWFDRIPTVTQQTSDYQELLANPSVDVVYVAVPHDLHERIYLDVLNAGKDLFGEKPFGIDLSAATKIASAAASTGRFVRCSSEMPFFPGAQRVIELAAGGTLGRLLQVTHVFHHSSDLNPDKPGNWKRISETCGQAGVMNDLGMHVCHVPFRLGWHPHSVYAQLQKGFPTRPDGKGGTVTCDTWDNALLHCWAGASPAHFPIRLEMHRLAPGATNTWMIEVLGTEAGARFSTATPKTLWTFARDQEQAWSRIDLGFQTPFSVVTGGIFEPGFADVIQQMWAAFLAERHGSLGGRFGCVTVEEAIASHALFSAALASHLENRVVSIEG